MGIIYCASCGKQVSDVRSSCPHCGHPLRSAKISAPEKQKASGLLVFGVCSSAVIVIIIVIIDMFGLILQKKEIPKRDTAWNKNNKLINRAKNILSKSSSVQEQEMDIFQDGNRYFK